MCKGSFRGRYTGSCVRVQKKLCKIKRDKDRKDLRGLAEGLVAKETILDVHLRCGAVFRPVRNASFAGSTEGTWFLARQR
jgi:hypothetical protein